MRNCTRSDIETWVGNYNENSARNANYIKIWGVTFYYSYDTLVAVNYGKGVKVCKNMWSNTTGKHLNWIDDDHSIRLSVEGFATEIKKACAWAGIEQIPTMRIA